MPKNISRIHPFNKQVRKQPSSYMNIAHISNTLKRQMWIVCVCVFCWILFTPADVFFSRHISVNLHTDRTKTMRIKFSGNTFKVDLIKISLENNSKVCMCVCARWIAFFLRVYIHSTNEYVPFLMTCYRIAVFMLQNIILFFCIKNTEKKNISTNT